MPRAKEESLCPKCSQGAVYHVIRKEGDSWYHDGDFMGSAYMSTSGTRATARIDFTSHSCRACGHKWATKATGRNEKWRVGYKTPVEAFQVDCILPHHVCHCGADYGLLTRKRGLIPTFCPYCGEEKKVLATDWLENLREDAQET